MPVGPATRRARSRFGPVIMPSRSTSVTRMAGQGTPMSRPQSSPRAARRPLRPAGDPHLAVRHVEGGDQPAGPLLGQGAEGVDVAGHQGADHHPVAAGAERPVDRLAVAQAAAELDPGAHAPAIRSISSRCGASPRAASRSTTWTRDHAGAGVRLQHGHRIVAVDRGAGVVPLAEADGPAVAEVNRGDQLHCAISRKFESSRSPAGPLRSGWNCVPITRPRPATAGKSRPWVQRARQSSSGTPSGA